MKARLAILLLGPLVCACQSSMPFYTMPANEPEWFKAKEAQAAAEGYPSAQAIPPKPVDLPSAETMKEELVDVELAGERVRNDSRAAPATAGKAKTGAFISKAVEKNIPPPVIEGDSRPK